MESQDPIFADQRYDVGYGTERGKVKQAFQIEVGQAPDFEETMAEFEDEAHRTEVMVLCAQLRVYQGATTRHRALRFVMIDHDHVDPTCFEQLDRSCRSGPTIERYEKLRTMFGDAAGHPVGRKAVTFFRAKRQKEARLDVVSAKYAGQQRDRSHAVDVVVAVQDDALAPIGCPKNAFDGLAQTR